MVIPAEADQVLWVVTSAVCAVLDVVGLEPVAAAASFDRALTLVPPEDE